MANIKYIQLREHILDYIRKKPQLFYRIMLFKPRYREILITEKTEIVIEGYPRCANTYAVAALWITQDRKLSVARHTHAIAQIIRASEKQLPTLLLIRNHEDAIISYVIREKNVDISLAINRYIDFYRVAHSLAKGFVISDFDHTITQYHSLLENLNTRYGLSLNVKRLNKTDLIKIQELVEDMERKSAGGLLSELKVSRPSKQRDMIKHKLREKLQSYPRMGEAVTLYRMLKEKSL